MRKLLLILFSMFLITNVYAIDNIKYVNAPSGLRLREDPDANSKVILTIPYHAKVEIIEEKNNIVTFENVNGKWTKVNYNYTNIGWVFGGFLIERSIDSIWEYPGGSYDKMIFTFFKDGNFTYKDFNTNTDSEGNWEYNLFKTQILVTFINNKEYWDKMIFSHNNITEIYKKYIGYFNLKERTVGFYIFKSAEEKTEYITFLGYNCFKKSN